MTNPEHSPDLLPSPPEVPIAEDVGHSEGERADLKGLAFGPCFDGALVLSCLEGEVDAIGQLYQKSVDHLKIVARRSEAKNLRRWGTSAFDSLIHDVVVEAMGVDLSGLRRIAYFEEPGAGYHSRLMQTFKSRTIDRHRRWEAKEGRNLSIDAEHGDRKLVPEAVDAGPDPAMAAVSSELIALMERLLHEVLAPAERELIMEEMTGEASRAERAIRLGIKEGALAVRIFRIREKLKSALGKALQHPDDSR